VKFSDTRVRRVTSFETGSDARAVALDKAGGHQIGQEAVSDQSLARLQSGDRHPHPAAIDAVDSIVRWQKARFWREHGIPERECGTPKLSSSLTYK
jgi:hypothetical protein